MDMKKHIFLLDDDDEILNTFAMILRKGGYDVTPENNGKEALSRLLTLQEGSSPIDLLITDVHMEGFNDLEWIDQLLKLPVKVPILAISGTSDIQMAIQLTKSGITDYIEKPCTADELLQYVAKILKN